MKYNFKIQGIDCANCAIELEKQINKVEGIEKATINFIAEKMYIECEEQQKEEIMKKVKKVIKKEEPDCEFKEI